MQPKNKKAANTANSGLTPTVSLRDYFAGVALQAYTQQWNNDFAYKVRTQLLLDIVNRHGNHITMVDAVSIMAYEVADSMLKARNGKYTPTH